MSERYDELRKIILGEVEAHGYLIVSRNSAGENEVRAQWDVGMIDGEPAIVFSMHLFGVQVFFEIERRKLDPGLEAEARRERRSSSAQVSSARRCHSKYAAPLDTPIATSA